MDTFDIHEAKKHPSRLVARSEPVVIAKAGKPLIEVVPHTEAEPVARPRPGTLEGLIDVPDAFDEMVRDEIERMSYGGPEV